ncbi:MAG: hypothetical protein GXP14_10320 [Gammaproteobacteria bacterium]|nr:hypothetical protein [Gammaproteobacteria bacterium]
MNFSNIIIMNLKLLDAAPGCQVKNGRDIEGHLHLLRKALYFTAPNSMQVIMQASI